MDKFLLHFRATEHSTTGIAPDQLMFGRPIRTKVPLIETPVNEKTVRRHDKIQKQKIKYFADKWKISFIQEIQEIYDSNHDPAKRD